MNILFITPTLDNKTGGGKLTTNIVELLRKNFNVIKYSCSGYNGSKLKKFLFALLNYSHGMVPEDIRNIRKIIDEQEIDVILFNHSYYGNVIKKLKLDYPNIPIVTYFHNVEYKFHHDIVKIKKKLGNWLVWKVISRNEKLATVYSDKLIGLNSRDNQLLFDTYKRYFDNIVPLFLNDSFNETTTPIDYTLPKRFGLFVGSLFYANYWGLKWLAKEVCPDIDIPIVVVGKGFETVKEEFVNTDNLIILGEVDDLSAFYNRAEFIVSPIFDGSGMKTKTAEALMYGKNIIGTSESFIGYDIVDGETGFICNTKDEFINCIQDYKGNKYNSEIRNLFLTKYSTKAIEKALLNIFS